MIGTGDLQGHWRRAWLRAPGIEDRLTSVHWMQCGSLYADIRIPADRPDTRGAAGLSDLPPRILRRLLDAEGFAGHITVENDICTWERRINWHGATKAIDAGHMAFGQGGALTETGIHADYSELWHRLDDDPSEGLELTGPSGRTGFLVSVGHRFVLGLGDPAAPATADVIAALDADRRPDGLEEVFARLHVLGRWSGAIGIADQATNPLIQGRTVLTRTAEGLVLHETDFHGASRQELLTPCPAPVVAA